ncbi:hypothetical protein [Actinomyces slackii]|uniref:Zn-dependent protease, contains TPR repeats n=1 Tax=Actinomyces slackii TaxID=52774 RepID=A0A3S4TDK3_9ACTO|nr:hypothetical protein [Actinomyces slackii]VEG75458.1 Uncharacterised protein [Actinomyces slackii]
MLQRLLNDDPQAAYEHGRYAASQAGRVAVVRESTGIAAYLAGLYTEALREIRAARRLSGLDLHRAIEADCERALGNRDKALQVVAGADPRQLDDVERAELAMVASGIRHEMGQTELGLMVIEDAIRARPTRSEILWRLHSVRADRLEDLGRQAEAQAIRERIGPDPAEQFEEEVEVFDIEDEDDDEPQQPTAEDAAAPDAEPETADAVDTAEAADSADPTASASPDDDTDEDAHWSAEFAQRVEDELTELLAEAEQDPSAPHEEV